MTISNSKFLVLCFWILFKHWNPPPSFYTVYESILRSYSNSKSEFVSGSGSFLWALRILAPSLGKMARNFDCECDVCLSVCPALFCRVTTTTWHPRLALLLPLLGQTLSAPSFFEIRHDNKTTALHRRRRRRRRKGGRLTLLQATRCSYRSTGDTIFLMPCKLFGLGDDINTNRSGSICH